MLALRDAVKYFKNPRVNAQRLKREQEISKREKKTNQRQNYNTNHDGISNSINRRVSEDL